MMKYPTLILSALAGGAQFAAAAAISLSPLQNGSFETDTAPPGGNNFYLKTATGWGTPNSSNTRIYLAGSNHFNEVGTGTGAYAADGVNALLLLNGSWINQPLMGLTDASPSTEVNLTAADLTGQTVRISFSLGHQTGYVGRGTIGIQYKEGGTTWKNYGVQFDTGSGTSTSSLVYLGIPESEWAQTYVDITLPGGITDTNNVQLYAVNNSGSAWFDNVQVTSVPEPSVALMASLGLLGLMRRRR
ncbi:MAG: PEP-CTERM sorting domain-containing protein [Akkermansiaceae bacterium]|nr:PEP-CTERM sorting domain-containing protein [Akkermansiaceae bacterium]